MFLFLAIMSSLAQDGRPKPQAFDEFEVTGEIQKPEAFVTYNRENLNKSYELDLRESFIPKILESIKKSPF